MSDFTIPGVTSKYNTGKMIEKLMKVEKIPLNRLEKQKKDFAEKKSVWQDLNRTLGKFKDSARLLFSFENPFKEHKAHSSDKEVLTATASRKAENENLEIQVIQLAGKDRFLSKSIGSDYKVPPGNYGFKVGESAVSFRYNGGSFSQFIAVLNKRTNGLLRGKLMKDTPDSQVFLLETTKSGSKNKLSFTEDSIKLGVAIGLIQAVNNSSREIDLADITLPQGKTTYLHDKKLTVDPMGTLTIPFTPPLKLGKNFVFEYDATIEDLGEKHYTPPSPPPGPTLGKPGKITYKGITIQDAKSKVIIPPWTPPPSPEYHETLNIFSVNKGEPLPSLKDTAKTQHFSIPASKLDSPLMSLTIDNKNTARKITISNIRAYDPRSRGGYAPLNPVEKAQDAVLIMEGIKVVRPNNKIENLLDGVTLELHDTSSKKIKLTVEPDRELIKNDVITFVGNYNHVMQNLQILTSNDESVINEIDYLSADEKKTAKKHLGMFQSDYTFIQMKNRLQQIAMSSYPTSKGRELNLLAQIGISTNSSGFGSSFDRTKLRGYLEINENKFDDALKTNLPAVKELFGNDTNNDLIVDSGIAYDMDKYVNVYTKVGGVIASRLASIKGRVSRLDNNILAMKSDLDRKEQDLKVKYGKMEGALQNLQDSSKSLDNFSKRNSNN